MSLSQWRFYQELIIDHTKIDEDLTDFPVLVKLDSSNFDFSKAKSDGSDVRFTLPDGTLLDYERERHDIVNQKAEYWVRIPHVSSSQDTVFRIYYGNPNAEDGANSTGVWSNNFVFVSHMTNYLNSYIKDSTLNGNNGTKYGNFEEVDGIIYKAQKFNGTDTYIHLSKNIFNHAISGTIEAWIKPNFTDNNLVIYCGSDWENRLYFQILPNKVLAGSFYDKTPLSGKTILTEDKFYYAVLTWTYPNMKIFLNGEIDVQNSYSNQNVGNVYAEAIGSYESIPLNKTPEEGVHNTFFNGIIDEVRVSLNEKSDTWIKATYYSNINQLINFDLIQKNVIMSILTFTLPNFFL